MKRSHSILSLGLALAVGTVHAGAELSLQDGQVLRGSEVRRVGDVYVLQPDAGGVVTIPVALVREVRLTADDVPPAPPPAAPTALREAEPETLAGKTVLFPRTSQQIEAFGKASSFARPIVDWQWRPESDWDLDPIKSNNFAPTRWAAGVIEFGWKPISAFDADHSVLQGGQSTFRKSPIDGTWQPEDGFAKKKSALR